MRTAYKVKSLYDGTEQPPVEERLLTVEDGRIGDILPWDAEAVLSAKGYSIVDYADCFLMPGLVDSHVHITLPGDGTAAEDFYAGNSGEEVVLTAARNAETALRSGITTLRDCGAKPETVFRLRRSIENGVTRGPDMVLCGSSLTITGGHTHFFEGEVDTVDEIVKRIRRLRTQGADYVKLIATGGGTRGVIQHAQMLSDAQLRAACEEAHRLGTYATAHVCTTATARAAVNGGVDMIEHLIFADAHNRLEPDDALADEIARKGIAVCITMSVLPVSIAVYEKLERPLTEREQAEYDMLCRFRDTIYEGFRRTCDRITYIPGTDAGWRRSAFDSLVECLVPMTELGYSNLKALHAATGLAAKLIGVGQKTGTLEKGKQADLLILKASPLEHIRNIEKVCAVYKKGVPV